jgi:hypothetical protein
MRLLRSTLGRTTASIAALLCIAATRIEPDLDVYRRALADYAAGQGAVSAVKTLAGWTTDRVEFCVQAVILRADARELETAAVMHLEIGTAISGSVVDSGAAYFDFASRLAAATLPAPAIVGGLSAERIDRVNAFNAMVNSVIASAYLAVHNVKLARVAIRQAQHYRPKSAAVTTLAGITDEVEALGFDADMWERVSQRTAALRQRSKLLVLAEREFEAALEQDPAYVLARLRLGRAQSLQNNLTAARATLFQGRDAAREPRHRFLAAMFLGSLLVQERNVEAAQLEYERARTIMPQSQDAVAASAYAELLSGNRALAQQTARQYTSAALDDAWWIYKTGLFDSELMEQLRRRVRQ